MVNVEAISTYIDVNFKEFGPNKRREVIRLLFEIAKREKCDFRRIIQDLKQTHNSLTFNTLKHNLMQRRFPQLMTRENKLRFTFSKVDIDPNNRLELLDRLAVIPHRFILEEAVCETDLVTRLKKKYPSTEFSVISSYAKYHRDQPLTIPEYNDRLKQIFLVKEDYDFYKRCACSNKSVYCGYHVVNLGSGCAFECSYCYLQDYINSPGIVIPANIEDFFENFQHYKQNIRLGSGELTDSLIFDHITDFSPLIVEFFRNYPGSLFEFKTKSANIENLLTVKPGKNIVVSWSLNPQSIVATTEFYTASLKERLEAAQKCVKAGYRVAFHFDPIIYFKGWEEEYRELVAMIFERIDPKQIAWLSLGTLRMTPRLKQIIENRFPNNSILDQEFSMGYDGKYRYGSDIRTDIYSKMKSWIRAYSEDVYIYLCMEEKSVCGSCEMPVKAARHAKIP